MRCSFRVLAAFAISLAAGRGLLRRTRGQSREEGATVDFRGELTRDFH